MITEEFKEKLTSAMNKGGWGKENIKEVLPLIEDYIKQLPLHNVSQRSELLKASGKEIDIDLVSGKKCRILKTVEESYLIRENGNEQIRWVGVSEIKTKSL